MGLFRVLLAIAVVIGHTYGHPGDGTMRFFALLDPYYAVQLFFVVSGFYMALTIDTKYSKLTNGTRLFYCNRALRLFPTYLSLLFAYLLILFCLQRADSILHKWSWNTWESNPFMLGYMVLANVCLAGLDCAPFFNADLGYSLALIPPAWSIGMELWFYLLAPWLVRANIKTLLALVCLSFLVRAGLLTFDLQSAPWRQRFFFAEYGYFVMGVIAYKYMYIYLSQLAAAGPSARIFGIQARKAMAMYMTAAVVAAVFMACFSDATVFVDRPWQTFFRSTLLTLAAALIIPGLFALTRQSKIDQFVANFSYPIYLTHFPIITLFGAEIGRANFGLNVVVLSVLASVIVIYLIEIPIDNWRKRVWQRENHASENTVLWTLRAA